MWTISREKQVLRNVIRSIGCIIGCFLGQLYLLNINEYENKKRTVDLIEVFMGLANVLIVIIATCNSDTYMITHETW